jgi:hypothetical protein
MSRNPPEKPVKTDPSVAARERRLAEALRANLRRRKAAAGRDDPENLPKTGADGD